MIHLPPSDATARVAPAPAAADAGRTGRATRPVLIGLVVSLVTATTASLSPAAAAPAHRASHGVRASATAAGAAQFDRVRRFDDAIDTYRSLYDKKLGVKLPGSVKVFESQQLQDEYDKAEAEAVRKAERKARKATKGMSAATRKRAIKRATSRVSFAATLAAADLTTERKGRDRVPLCRIDVLPKLKSGDLTLAHELFHCYQSYLAPQPPARFEWVREGLAEWAMTRFKGGPAAARDWYRAYLDEPSRPLTAMAYEAVGFWAALEQVTGDAVWSRVKPVLLAKDAAAAFTAAGADGAAFLDAWPSLSARLAPPGGRWQQTLPASIKGPGKLRVVGADTRLQSPPYVRVLATLKAPGGRPVIHTVAEQGHLRAASARDYGPTADKWFCATGRCECPAGTTQVGPGIEHLNGRPAHLGLTGGIRPGAASVRFLTLRQWQDLFCRGQEVPNTISGTISGTRVQVPGPGTEDVRWQASVTFTRSFESVALDSEAFRLSSRYRVSAFSGTVSPIPVPVNDTLCHSQSGSRPLTLADIDPADTGDSFPGASFDPWGSAGRGPLYNMVVEPAFDSQPLIVGTQVCPGTPPQTEPYGMFIPDPLLMTDGWSGLPSGTQPVAQGDRFAGTYSYDAPGSRFTWTWDLRGSDYVSVPEPGTPVPLVGATAVGR